MSIDLNQNGGTIPKTKIGLQMARAADLLTLPPDISGTNCGNCQFIQQPLSEEHEIVFGFCNHPKLKQWVTERQCCAFWSAEGVIRP